MDVHSYLSGRLEDVHFPELLLEISQRRETGIFHLTRQQISKEIYFQDGRIVFAKSNDPDHRLGELLLRRGKITYRQLEDSAAKIVPGVRLGTILVQDGYLKAGELYQGVIDQVEEIVYSVFEWSDGEYSFETCELPGKEVITLSISTPDIINMGIARIWRWSWISKGVGSLDSIYLRRKEWDSISRKMLITPAMQSLIDMMERPLPLEEILNASRINSYETCKQLWTLLSIGIIERIPKLELPAELVSAEETPAAPVPSAEPSDFAETAPFAEALPSTEPEAVVEPAPLTETAAFAETVPSTETAATEIISWQPRRLPPLPSPAAETLPIESDSEQTPQPPELPLVMPLDAAGAPTVEFSFSDLAEFTDQVQEIPPSPPSETQAEDTLRKEIAKFNELHRYIFEMLRIEMGAGVGNFLTKILKKAMEQSPLIFEGIRMNEYGELDAEALQASIQGNLVEDYTGAFQWLLEEERAKAAAFLDKKRVEAIETGLHKIQEKQREAD